MKTTYTLLIADRNSHVREFLKREMTADGYRIILAERSGQVMEAIYRQHHETVDLLIIDPDLPDAEAPDLIGKLLDRIPCLPVIIHAFPGDSEKLAEGKGMTFVEKEGRSVERLKQVVGEILDRPQG